MALDEKELRRLVVIIRRGALQIVVACDRILGWETFVTRNKRGGLKEFNG